MTELRAHAKTYSDGELEHAAFERCVFNAFDLCLQLIQPVTNRLCATRQHFARVRAKGVGNKRGKKGV